MHGVYRKQILEYICFLYLQNIGHNYDCSMCTVVILTGGMVS
jgi:hypothetical protein